MALEIRHSNKRIRLSNPNFQDQILSCVLEETECGIRLPFAPLPHEDPQNYSMFLFSRHDCAESDIFQVYLKSIDDRIGWIFPLQALSSEEHDFVDNKHWARYATVAILKMVIEEDEHHAPLDANAADLSLSDWRSYYTDVLVICNAKVPPQLQGAEHRLWPNLSLFGYFLSPTMLARDSLNSYMNDAYQERIGAARKSGKLDIEPILLNLAESNVILDYYVSFNKYENHPLLHFHLMYQAIEYLIEEVFRDEYDVLIGNNVSSAQFKDNQGSLKNITNEMTRIEKLVACYCENCEKYDPLHTLCNLLLHAVGRPTRSRVTESLYAVRNVLTHSYRSIITNHHGLLYQINVEFDYYLVQLLTTFDSARGKKKLKELRVGTTVDS